MKHYSTSFPVLLIFIFIGFAAQSIQLWANPPAQTNSESDQLSRQLRSYFHAELHLLQGEQAMERDNQRYISELEGIDAVNGPSWDARLQASVALYEMRAKYISDLQNLVATELQERDPKRLRFFIHHRPGGARNRYRQQQDLANKSQRVNQSLKELVEYCRQARLARLGHLAS